VTAWLLCSCNWQLAWLLHGYRLLHVHGVFQWVPWVTQTSAGGPCKAELGTFEYFKWLTTVVLAAVSIVIEGLQQYRTCNLVSATE